MLADALTSVWVDDPQPERSGLHDDLAAHPSRRHRVIGTADCDMSVEVNNALQALVIRKTDARQRQQAWALFIKHLSYLPLGGSVNASCSPAFIPMHQERILLINVLKLLPLRAVSCVWPTADSTLPFKSGAYGRQGMG